MKGSICLLMAIFGVSFFFEFLNKNWDFDGEKNITMKDANWATIYKDNNNNLRPSAYIFLFKCVYEATRIGQFINKPF